MTFTITYATLVPGAPRNLCLWWLSFCDTSRAEGSQFLGGCVVRAASFLDAVQESWAQGCNPGGECRGVPVENEGPVRAEHVNKLFRTKEEIEAVFGTVEELPEEAPGGAPICKHCGRTADPVEGEEVKTFSCLICKRPLPVVRP